ncbi:MAG TPA: DNA polymerase III subunit delta [Gemmatimonadales bacterium]|jgi:DNA polymerase-3 subunit delta
MPRVTLDKLRIALSKGPPAPAYYIHGPESILKDDALAQILDHALDPGTRDFNLDIVSAQQLDPADLPAACSTLPMMAERRVVVLRDIESWKRKSKGKLPAVKYLDRPMPETVLVIVQGNDDEPDDELSSRCVSIECTAPVGDRLEAWLDQRLAERGVTITAAAREHLLRATGGDLGMLTAEIEKLRGLDNSAPIDVDMVGALVGVRFGETVDDWRDAILRDDTARALAVLPRLLDTAGVSGVSMVSTLGASLIALRWARATAERHKVRDNALALQVKRDLLLRVRPRVGSYDGFAQLLGQVVGRWSPTRIGAALQAALLADSAIKNTTISDTTGIVTDLVLTLAMSRTRKAA